MIFGKYINKFYKKYFWHFFFGIITLIFVDYIQLFIPEIVGNIVGSVKNGGINIGNYEFLIIHVIYIAVIGLGMFIGRHLWRVCIFGESIRIQSDLRKEMFLKTEKLTQRFYKQNKTGALLAYFSNDLETLEEAFGFGVVQLVDGVFLLIMSVVKMSKIHGTLTLIVLIPLAMLGVSAFFIDRLLEAKYEKRQKAFENMSDFAQENFTGIRVIKAFVKEKKELKLFAKEAKKNKDANINYVRTSAALDVIFDALIYLVFGIIMIGGSYLVYLNIQTLGETGIPVEDLVKFVGFADTLIWPVFALAGVINLIARARTSYKRIESLLDEKVEINDLLVGTETKEETELTDETETKEETELTEETKNKEETELTEETENKEETELTEETENKEETELIDETEIKEEVTYEIKGGIEFKNFNFAYPDDPERLILKEINLKINPGENIGIVGKIGSGKSTLVNMLFRLYNVEENTLFIDDFDIMHLPVKKVRDVIGYCPQDNFLFSDTVRSNIAFSNPDLPLEEVEAAAEFANVKENILEFTNQYDTLIGEKGVSLSGGQKQRISIARAVVKDPKILVLDDSVSAVDVKTEETILHNIKEKRKGKTTILIASRVSTVMNLDRIIVLKDGRVDAFGTHEECLQQSKVYARMVELQSLEKEMEGE